MFDISGVYYKNFASDVSLSGDPREFLAEILFEPEERLSYPCQNNETNLLDQDTL